MEIVLEKIDDLNAVLVANVSIADHKDEVYTVLKDYARKASLPGFRPGKVPVSLIKKMYGKGVVYEALNKSLSSKLNDYVKAQQLNLVGSPLPVPVGDIDLDPDSSATYEFRYEVGMAPTLALNLTPANPSPLYNVSVDAEVLNKEIGHIQSRYGEMTNPEVSEEGDILYGKVEETDAEGNVLEDGLGKMIALNPERIPSEGLKAQMAGKKADDIIFPLTMTDIFASDDETRRFWETNVQGQQVAEVNDAMLEMIKEKTWRFEVRKINRMGKAEINQELFDKAFGEGTLTSEDDFRARVQADLQGFFGEEALRLYRARSIKELVEANFVELPEAFLRKWLLQTREGVNETNVDNVLPDYLRSLRWSLIVDDIIRRNPELRVEQEHILEAAKEKARRELLQYMPDSSDETVERFAQYYMQDEKATERLFNEVLENRIFGYVMAQNPPKQQDITASAFMEEVKKL